MNNIREEEPRQRRILMLPWLAHGHISPFLELAKKLTKGNFHIYFCSTSVNLKPIRDTLPQLYSSIECIDLELPCFPELPPCYHTTKDLPPHLMNTLKTAFDSAKPAFTEILKALKPSIVIYDFLQPWVPLTANEVNIKALLFLTCGAATCSLLNHYGRNNSSKEYPFPALTFPETECEKLMPFLMDMANGVITNYERMSRCMESSSKMILMKSSRGIEDKYISYFEDLAGKEIVAVGPLIQEQGKNRGDAEAEIIKWLEESNPGLVVFISFGSEYFLSREEIEEIAYGLELSDVGFIWVIRFHGSDKMSMQDVMPDGFRDRVGSRGMVVEGWAPQAKILSHHNTKGFISHCGWSSTLEAIMFGVPIIAMPMQLEQPFNAKLVVEMGVGLEVEKKDGKFKREEVAKAIREVVVEEKGKEIGQKAKELREKMRDRQDEEMNAVVEKLEQLIAE